MDIKTEWPRDLGSRHLLSAASLWSRPLDWPMSLQHWSSTCWFYSSQEESGRMKCSAWGGLGWPQATQAVSRDSSKYSWIAGSQTKTFSVLGDKDQKEVFMCEIGCSVVCSLFFIWVLEIHEIILSMIRTRLKLVLIIRQIAGCPQKSYIVYISYINNNSYFLWLWILHVKVNLQFPLLIFSVFFATPLK